MSKRKKINENQAQNSLTGKIENQVKGLCFVSETDAEILPFDGIRAESVTKDALLAQIKFSENPAVEEINFEDFFSRLTKIEEWFSDEENQNARKFADLKNLLQSELKDLKVFKVGTIEIDIYVVGLDSQNLLKGIKTKAVET